MWNLKFVSFKKFGGGSQNFDTYRGHLRGFKRGLHHFDGFGGHFCLFGVLGCICFGGKGNPENILHPWGCLDTHENSVKLKINFSWP